MSQVNSTIRCLINGETVLIDGKLNASKSVLNFLREDRQLPGSKEGCAEGDCGACTVVLGEMRDNALHMRAVNACIQFVASLNGKALFTVEYLRQASQSAKSNTQGTLHPVQQALVDHHGSQCGFCTPGFVMSLWNVYLDHQQQQTRPDNTQLRTALSGNLCRCTGYQPILKAGEAMFDYPQPGFDRSTIEQQLRDMKQPEMLDYEHAGQHFFAPRTLPELTQLKAQYPQATILAGSTDIGLWVNKAFMELGDIIYLGEVAALKEIRQDNDKLIIGAAASLDDAFAQIEKYYPQIRQQRLRFASTPIRNAGTLGGNIANGSPIGDSMPWLIVLGTELILSSEQGQRHVALQDLYLGYMKKDLAEEEIIESIIIPMPRETQLFRSYKLSKRYDSDISAVCAAFSLDLDGTRIRSARVGFGGMAAIPMRAAQTEQALLGKDWNEETAYAAMQALEADYQPMSDMRASSDYRLEAAKNLLYRFYLETQPGQALSESQTSVFANA